MSLQEQADARKAKLAALKKRKTLHDSGAPQPAGAAAADDDDDRSVFPLSNACQRETDLVRVQARGLQVPQLRPGDGQGQETCQDRRERYGREAS